MNSAVPVKVLCDAIDPHPPLSSIIAIAAGRNFAMALDEENKIWTWGDNYYGQLGDGTTDYDRSYAKRIDETTLATTIAAGNNHALALTTGGNVAAWGSNYSGQVGNKTNNDQPTPHGVLGETFPITGITKISANGNSSFALKNGKILSWGENGDGQLGSGTTEDRNWADLVLAAPSTPLTGITSISAGNTHALAIKNSSTISWGSNNRGELGDGTITDRYFPVEVKNSDGSPFTGGVSIAAGDDFSIVQKTDGTVWTIGRNDYGQLGDGTKKWITYEVKNFTVKDFPWAMFLPAFTSPGQ
jgi:alpha-tubulin suppressor-like RCC1 family protein